jgi:hypothetical protein
MNRRHCHRPRRNLCSGGLHHPCLVAGVDGVHVYQVSFGLASGRVLRRSQGTLLPLSVNPRYQICGTMCNTRSNLISGKHFDLEKGFCI